MSSLDLDQSRSDTYQPIRKLQKKKLKVIAETQELTSLGSVIKQHRLVITSTNWKRNGQLPADMSKGQHRGPFLCISGCLACHCGHWLTNALD
jgi:hypothetical protein